MLQVRFDLACSWTVLESASYRPRPLEHLVMVIDFHHVTAMTTERFQLAKNSFIGLVT
jgi:hypothetical protein